MRGMVKIIDARTVAVKSKNNAFLLGIVSEFFPPCQFIRQERDGKNLRLIYHDYKKQEYRLIVPA